MSRLNSAMALQPGEERFEEFFSQVLGKDLIQYDYRAHGGRLFSTVARTAQEARDRRDRWAKIHGIPIIKKEV